MLKDMAFYILLAEGVLVSIILICWLLHLVWLFVNRTKNESTWFIDYLRFKKEYQQWKAEKRGREEHGTIKRI